MKEIFSINLRENFKEIHKYSIYSIYTKYNFEIFLEI